MIESKIRYLEELRRLGEDLGSHTELEGLKIAERLIGLCDSIESDLGIKDNKPYENITLNVTCNASDAVKKAEDIVGVFESLTKVSRQGV